MFLMKMSQHFPEILGFAQWHPMAPASPRRELQEMDPGAVLPNHWNSWIVSCAPDGERANRVMQDGWMVKNGDGRGALRKSALKWINMLGSCQFFTMNNVQDKTDTWKIVKFMECLEPI